MTIHGLAVSVDYADYLARGIARWRQGLASLLVVTTPADHATQALARRHGADLVETNLFTRDGAVFNKGRAMEYARAYLPWSDWILFIDADVIPPVDWKERLEAQRPQPGWLYGAVRYAGDGTLEDVGQPRFPSDVPGVGYFQLFHSADPAVQVAPGEPLIDTHWIHGGNYDNRFLDRWRRRCRPVRTVPFRLAHLGPRDNWFGRGNRAAFAAMQTERRRRGGRWDHECIQVTP
jgi:glycosyltransferase involved in cell wall biosynthesis